MSEFDDWIGRRTTATDRLEPTRANVRAFGGAGDLVAGGRLSFHKPLLLCASVIRTSAIVSAKEKTGQSGQLVFAAVRHELDGGDGLAMSEEQGLMYKEATTSMLPGAQLAFDGVPLHVCGAKADDGAEMRPQQGEPKNMVGPVQAGAPA